MASTTRQALLQALSAAEGAYISGQQLAQQLGSAAPPCTRRQRRYRAQGYALEAASRRGYRLLGGDPFCAEAVGPLPCPGAAVRHAGKHQPHRKAAGAGRRCPRHAGAGGRADRRARAAGAQLCQPGGQGVYCSIVLRPPLPAANAQTATIGAAVAVCRAVRTLCGLELAIKWVNDLYYKGKKVCGILTEAGTDLESGQLEWLVVGIGLNLTATAEDFPRN